MLSIAQMRDLIATQKGNFRNSSKSSEFFNFSKLNIGDEVRIRFVKDGDENNQMFWRNRAIRTLSFDGLISEGKTYTGTVYVDVPAFNLKSNEADTTLPEEYRFTSKEDVIQEAIKNLYDEDKDLYAKFKRKEGYLLRGFVRDGSDDPKINYFVFSKQLYEPLVKFTSTEQEEAFPDYPFDENNGRDFILKVSQSDGRKNYSTSDYSLKTSPLTDKEREVLAAHKDDKLYEKLPKKPTDEQLMVMAEMYAASRDGKPYDFDKWSSSFKPNNAFKDSNGIINIRSNGTTDNTPTEVPSETVAAQLSALSTPKTISNEEVNEAIKQNTSTTNSTDVQNMLTQLMAQFQQPQSN